MATGAAAETPHFSSSIFGELGRLDDGQVGKVVYNLGEVSHLSFSFNDGSNMCSRYGSE